MDSQNPAPSPMSPVALVPTPAQLLGLIQACGKYGVGQSCWPEKSRFTRMSPCTDAPLGPNSGGFDKLTKLQFSVAYGSWVLARTCIILCSCRLQRAKGWRPSWGFPTLQPGAQCFWGCYA